MSASGVSRWAVALLSWTFARVGPLKLTEFLALLAAPPALLSRRTWRPVLNCFGPFLIASALACLPVFATLGTGDGGLSSDKALYASPALNVAMTGVRIAVFLVVVLTVTHFFRTASPRALVKALDGAYLLAVLPGLVQLARLYSGFWFDIPFFERAGYGPFSGVFDSGYIRLMGFEFEPLGYATSLVVACCLRFHTGRRLPWLGLIVLLHTFSAGALAGFALAYGAAGARRHRQLVVPVYFAGFVGCSVLVTVFFDAIFDVVGLFTSVAERVNAWAACIRMWLDHPAGVGLGLYGYMFNLYDSANFPADKLDYYPNNDPAMFLATGGILYLLAYLWIFHLVISSARSRWIRTALIALLVQSISSYLLYNPAAIVVFGLVLSGRERFAGTFGTGSSPLRPR